MVGSDLLGKTTVAKQLKADLGIILLDAALVIDFAIKYAIAGKTSQAQIAIYWRQHFFLRKWLHALVEQPLEEEHAIVGTSQQVSTVMESSIIFSVKNLKTDKLPRNINSLS